MKSKKIFLRRFGIFLLSLFVLSLIFVVRTKAAIVPDNNKESGSYTLNDIVRTGVNVADWILGIVGSLTLLMFIYGGFMLLISAGNAESVAQGKKIILGSVMGLIIVFSSYLIIQFFTQSMGVVDDYVFDGQVAP